MSKTPRGRAMEVSGAALYYEEHGDGPPLILPRRAVARPRHGVRRAFARRQSQT